MIKKCKSKYDNTYYAIKYIEQLKGEIDFSFCYFKFENFLTSIPDIYLKNRLIKDSKSKKEIN